MSVREKIMHKISDYVSNERDKIKSAQLLTMYCTCSGRRNVLTEYENFVYSACLHDWSKL
jgi:hypothetical protein